MSDLFRFARDGAASTGPDLLFFETRFAAARTCLASFSSPKIDRRLSASALAMMLTLYRDQYSRLPRHDIWKRVELDHVSYSVIPCFWSSLIVAIAVARGTLASCDKNRRRAWIPAGLVMLQLHFGDGFQEV